MSKRVVAYCCVFVEEAHKCEVGRSRFYHNNPSNNCALRCRKIDGTAKHKNTRVCTRTASHTRIRSLDCDAE